MSCRHRLARHVRRLIVWLCPGRPDYRVSITGPRFILSNVLTDGESRMAFELHDTDPGFQIALAPTKDRAGEAPPAGKIEWSCSDPDVLTITPSPDGLSCDVKPTQPVKLGSATVTAKDTSHPKVPRKPFDFEVVPEDLEDYDAIVTPLAPAPEAPTGDHQVVS